jgi:PhnB protein
MVADFGAKRAGQLLKPDGSIGHTELRVGDSLIMLSEASAQAPATPIMLHLPVGGVDAAFDRAVKAGGVVAQRLAVQSYGDRSGGVKEPGGNTISIATHVEDVPPDELRQRAGGGDAGQGLIDGESALA